MSRLLFNGQEASIDERLFASFHGNSIFTTLRSKNGEPLLWEAHWQRLSSHAAFFGYALAQERDVRFLIDESLNKSAADQKIRVIINADGDCALSFETYEKPLPSLYEGVKIGYSQEQLHPTLKEFKTGNSWPYQRAMLDAKKNGIFEMLMLDALGYVVDGARTSIMHFDGIKLRALRGGLLGIMREEALRAAVELFGVAYSREYLKPEALIVGQLLLANCLIGVVPVGPARYPLVAKLVERFRMDI